MGLAPALLGLGLPSPRALRVKASFWALGDGPLGPLEHVGCGRARAAGRQGARHACLGEHPRLQAVCTSAQDFAQALQRVDATAPTDGDAGSRAKAVWKKAKDYAKNVDKLRGNAREKLLTTPWKWPEEQPAVDDARPPSPAPTPQASWERGPRRHGCTSAGKRGPSLPPSLSPSLPPSGPTLCSARPG